MPSWCGYNIYFGWEDGSDSLLELLLPFAGTGVGSDVQIVNFRSVFPRPGYLNAGGRV
ncbi:MAG: hypothetical protein ACR2JB_12085 [Bryobacteraceae bacterium]